MSKPKNPVRKIARALKFATLRAQGHNQTDAWRQITPNWETIKPADQYSMAWQFANDPIVKLKVAEVLQNAAHTAMVTSARYIAETQDLRDWAMGKGNANAVMQAQKLIGSAAAVLQDRGTLTVEHQFEAEKLRQQLRSNGVSDEAIDSLMPRTSFGQDNDTKH